jgi:hypothetical protein
LLGEGEGESQRRESEVLREERTREVWKLNDEMTVE